MLGCSNQDPALLPSLSSWQLDFVSFPVKAEPWLGGQRISVAPAAPPHPDVAFQTSSTGMHAGFLYSSQHVKPGAGNQTEALCCVTPPQHTNAHMHTYASGARATWCVCVEHI